MTPEQFENWRNRLLSNLKSTEISLLQSELRYFWLYTGLIGFIIIVCGSVAIATDSALLGMAPGSLTFFVAGMMFRHLRRINGCNRAIYAACFLINGLELGANTEVRAEQIYRDIRCVPTPELPKPENQDG